MRKHSAIVASMICLLTMLAVSTVFMNQAIFLELSQYFQIDIAKSRISFSVVSLSYAVTFLVAGPFMDQGNLPKIAILSALLLAGALMITSFANNFQSFIVYMIPIGCCAALIPASMFPFMSTVATEGNRGFYVGLIVASATLGVILGRVLSGIFTSLFNWYEAYRIFSMIILISALISYACFPRPNNVRSNNEYSFLTRYTQAIRLFCQLRVITVMVTGGTLFFGFLGVVTFLSYRLNYPPFNFDAGEIGWLSFAGLSALVAPFSGKLFESLNTGKVIVWGLASSLICCIMLGVALTVPGITIGLLFLFLSVYTCHPLIFMMVWNSVSNKSLGTASSLYIFFCIGGGSLASIVLGPIWVTLGWFGVVAVCSCSLMISLTLMLILNHQQSLQSKPAPCD